MRRILGSWLGLAMLATALVVGGTVGPAYACSCEAPHTDQQAFNEADAVFVGRVAHVSFPNSGPIVTSTDPAIWTFDVTAVFKGHVTRHQELVSARNGASCGLELGKGEKYIVFASLDAGLPGDTQPGPGQLSGWLCNGTRRARDGPLDVAGAHSRAPTNHPSTRNLVVEGLAGFESARTGLTSDRVLVVSFVGAPPAARSNGCWEGYRARVRDDPTGVTVSIRRLRNAGQLVACPLIGYSRTLRVELPSALGDRRVFDGASGQSRPVYDGARLLQPALPEGWRPLSEYGTPCCGDGGNELEWARTFGLRRGSSPMVTIVQGPALMTAPGTMWGYSSTRTATVRGYIADVVAVPGSMFVRWIQDGRAFIVASAGGLSIDELVQIARSLR